jgi:hypothetical protein
MTTVARCPILSIRASASLTLVEGDIDDTASSTLLADSGDLFEVMTAPALSSSQRRRCCFCNSEPVRDLDEGPKVPTKQSERKRETGSGSEARPGPR